MRFLIDGYNLLHYLGLAPPGDGPQALAFARQRLLDHLSPFVATLQGKMCVVFDARNPPPGANPEQHYKGIHVLFAAKQEADDLIEQLIRRASASHLLAVVSNDHRLKLAADRRQVRFLACGEFLDLAEATPIRGDFGPAPGAERTALTPEEAQYWQSEFGAIEKDPEFREFFDDLGYPGNH